MYRTKNIVYLSYILEIIKKITKKNKHYFFFRP